MPGLPRKSTIKQFKRLMKKSEKSRTNKSFGSKDPSLRRIDTYEQFKKFNGVKSWLRNGKNYKSEDSY